MKTVARGFRNLETCSGYAQSHANIFLSIVFQKRWFYFKTRFGHVKKHKLFITVFTTIHWVKSDWSVEPMLLTSTLLMGTLPGNIGKAG